MENYGSVAPHKLTKLEQKIDEVAGSKHWIYIDAAAVHEEARRGWNVRGPEAKRLLLLAVVSGDTETVRAFIEEGTDVNARVDATSIHRCSHEDVDIPHWEATPLQGAGSIDVVRLLISAGAKVNAASWDLGPPLVYAAERGDVDSIKALIEAGAKVNRRLPGGATALMKAAESGNPAAVEALLRAGAHVHAKDLSGKDALNYAHDAAENPESLEMHYRDAPFLRPNPDYGNRLEEIRKLLISANAGAERARIK